MASPEPICGPFILVFSGPPCAGKSTLLEKIVQSGHLVDVSHSMDRIRSKMLPGPIHDKPRRSTAYRRMHFRVVQAVKSGKRVAVDATYMPAECRAELADISLRLHAPMYVVQCVCTGPEAAKGFEDRDPKHPGRDLAEARVRQLAETYERFDGALLITRRDTNAVKTVEDYVRAGVPTDVVRWARHNFQLDPIKETAARKESETTKLSERTVKLARLEHWVYAILLTLLVVFGLMAYGTFIFATARFFFSGLQKWSEIPHLRSEKLLELGTYLAAAAGLGTLLVTFVHDGFSRWRLAREISNAGNTPRYEGVVQPSAPSDLELYRTYRVRMKLQDKKRMPLRDVPIFFHIIPTKGESFRVTVKPRDLQDDIPSTLESEAAQRGFDWRGFAAWREAEIKRTYFRKPSVETGVRCIGLTCMQRREWILEGIPCRYYDYTCREHSADLYAAGVLPDMRRLFEGPRWDERAIDLADIKESAKRYSMSVSVTGLVLTRDGYFFLQRRSGYVATGIGSLAASVNGRADWKKDCNDLAWSARRELEEEIGIQREWLDEAMELVPPTAHPFLGAAYNLRYGRDLNFYCCFQTRLESWEVAAHRKRHLFERSRARDAWEVANLVLLDSKKVSVSSLRSGELERLLPGRARHLLGALYAWAVYVGRE